MAKQNNPANPATTAQPKEPTNGGGTSEATNDEFNVEVKGNNTWDFDANPTFIGKKLSSTFSNFGRKDEEAKEVFECEDTEGKIYNMPTNWELVSKLRNVPLNTLFKAVFEGTQSLGGGRTQKKFTVRIKGK